MSCQLPQYAYKKAAKEHVTIPNVVEVIAGLMRQWSDVLEV